MPRGLRLQAEVVFPVYFLGRRSEVLCAMLQFTLWVKGREGFCSFFPFFSPLTAQRRWSALQLPACVRVCALGGAAGRLCASGKQRMFAGAAACRNKGNPISQHSGCEQDFSFNAAPSVVLLRPAKLLQLLQPSFCSLSPRKE